MLTALLTCVGSHAVAATLCTDNGLCVDLDGNSGKPSAIAVDSRQLPLLVPSSGGLTFSEFIPVAPAMLLHETCETTPTFWTNASGDNWDIARSYFTWNDAGGVSNSGYMTLGGGTSVGVGMATANRFPVIPGAALRISWAGRVSDLLSKYIVAVRVFNTNGVDITSTAAASSGWYYSPVSKAHVIAAIANLRTGAWEPFAYDYEVPPDAASIRVSLRYWNGGLPYVQIDDLRLEIVGGLQKPPPSSVSGVVTQTSATGYAQSADLPAEGLQFRTTWNVEPACIRIRVDVESTTTPQRDRPLRIRYSLPVNMTGWTWDDDIVQSRLILPGATYSNSFVNCGHGISLHPMAGVRDSGSGIALAVPMDVPRIQQFSCETSTGLCTDFDVCLTTNSLQTSPCKAFVEFVVYRYDPAWGFRSVASAYYGLFPRYFAKRVAQEGCWLYPISPDQIPNPEDFGFAFFESGTYPAAVREACARLGIGIYHYMEPWGAWQDFGTITNKPTYEARVDTLKTWAGQTTTTAKWLGAPRAETARAVLASAYVDAAGKYPTDAFDYYWHQWGGRANQFWKCNGGPTDTTATLGGIYKRYMIDATGANRQGMYVDSVSGDGSLGAVEDYAPAHLAEARQPLCFSATNGAAVLLAPLDHYDFLDWLSTYEHAAGRFVMANTFPTSYRFHAHQADIMGSEVSDVRESSRTAALRRVLTGKKPNTNLLQWWRGANMVTASEVEQYIKEQMYWGFFPGIASCGGGIGWGETIERYFLHPELYERDRPTFRRFIPVIKELSTAGWEPLTGARSTNSSVGIERFGNPQTKHIYLTCRNDGTTTASTRITLDSAALNLTSDDLRAMRCQELPDRTVTARYDGGLPGNYGFEVTLSPADVRVFRLSYDVTSVSVPWHLLE